MDGIGTGAVGGVVFTFLLLDGVDVDVEVDGSTSSFVGFLFGIAPDERRVSRVGAPDVDVALDDDAIARTGDGDGDGDGAGMTATGVTGAPACFRTKSSRWYFVSDRPRSAARFTIILSIPYA